MLIYSLHCGLLQELKNLLLKTKNQEKIFILKAIGNFGHKTLYKPLLQIIQDNKNTLEERVTAVYALRRIAPQVPQKVIHFASHARFLKPTRCSHMEHLITPLFVYPPLALSRHDRWSLVISTLSSTVLYK